MRNVTCLTLLFVLSTHAGSSQTTADSVEIYSTELRAINRAFMDSMRNNPRGVFLRERIDALKPTEDSYVAFALWLQFVSADYSIWNADNVASGFPAVSGPVGGIGMGMSTKYEKLVYDFNFFTAGVKNKSKKGDESIETNVSTFCQFQFGYDLLRHTKVNLYPYAGLGFRSVNIEYSAPAQLNPNPTGISSILQTSRSVSDNQTNITYQAGIGFDIVLAMEDKSNGVMLFFKAGMDRSFSNKSFNLDGYKYNPHFKYGQWTVTMGVKQFGR